MGGVGGGSGPPPRLSTMGLRWRRQIRYIRFKDLELPRAPEPFTHLTLDTPPPLLEHFEMHKTLQIDHRHEISLFDDDNPRSMKFLLPEAFVKILEATFNGPRGHLFGLSHKDLLTEMQAVDKFPNELDYKLKENFWAEYTRVIENYKRPQPMNITQVIKRIVGKEAFYKFYLTQPEKLAFLLLPPLGYEAMLESAMMYAVHKIKRALDIPVFDKNNGAKLENIRTIMGIFRELKISIKEVRGYGAPPLKKLPSRAKSETSGSEEVGEVDSQDDMERFLAEETAKRETLEKMKKEQEPVIPKDSLDG